MSEPAAVPRLRLNSGREIPQLGFGLYKILGEDAERAVEAALEAGYRHLDTASLYENEAEVGRAIAASGLPRQELFVTTKLWHTENAHDRAMAAFDRSLDALRLDYVDLYLIHWPAPRVGRYLEAWEALEEIAASGRARSIGVSNFLPEHLEAVIGLGGTVPAVNQVELHPLFQQRELREWQEPRGIRTEAWGPLGQGKYRLDEIPVLAGLAQRHGRSIQQIVIRWQLQEGVILIPKSSHPERIAQNLAVLDFELGREEIAAIRALDERRRIGVHPDERN